MKPADTLLPVAAPSLSALEVVKLYHAHSKHHFGAYARGPGMLDWDAQPAPFRHYAGAPALALPLLSDLPADDPLHALANCTLASVTEVPQPTGLASIGVLLNLALGLTAWKALGPDRWAVRANPSSGNLHPAEAWLITRGIDGLVDGVHHYRPEIHALELRARDTTTPAATPQLQIALSTVMWREAWKYGDRGFRYCQLDVGHAAAALAHAAAMLGWSLRECGTSNAALAQRLGLDRDADFPVGRHDSTEREEAELLLAVDFGTTDDTKPLLAADTPEWFGRASRIDPAPRYRWPLIDDVAAATRRPAATVRPPSLPLPVWHPESGAAERGKAALFLGRRSAQRFDASHRMAESAFAHLLRVLGNRLQPGRLGAAGSSLMAVLFAHRVDTLAPGVYILSAGDTAPALPGLHAHVRTFTCEEGEIAQLWHARDFEQVELHRLARSLHCHQDIAANACLALGLVSAFDAPLTTDPPAYRDLYRAAGQAGHALYLAAEALGLRGTGIGCFFDDPVHTLLGLTDTTWQSLYHFTIGKAIDDARIEVGPPYPARPSTPPLTHDTPTS